MTTTKSDCGCTGATGTGAGNTRTRASRTAEGAWPSAPPVTAATSLGASPGGTVALGGFQSLNPVDGLFLRADHLKKIQDYARALTAAVATSAGAGIVYGLGVTLAGSALEVSPGLAVTPHGQALLLATTVRITLDDSHLPPRPVNGFWRVELRWSSALSGSAPVYGSLCNDGCAGGGAVIQPWQDEGVEIVLTPDSLPGLDGVPLDRRTNWLASGYFERERASAPPWLVPTGAGTAVEPLRSHDWRDPTPLPAEEAVPLALVQLVDGSYRVDVWAARRLADGPRSSVTWLGRLAMRPWSVFLAQILQFEAELDTSGAAGEPLIDVGAAAFYESTAKGLLEETRRFIDGLSDKDPLRSRKVFQRLEEVVERAAVDPVTVAPPASLATRLGIGELPPAGYLQLDAARKDAEASVRSFFGDRVDVRIRRVRADQVADEVMAAQSRDRIPLDPVPGTRPKVDVLVPTEPADKAELWTADYGWVAFVRRGPEADLPVAPVPETEEVAVYLYVADSPEKRAQDFTAEDFKRAQQSQVGSLTFPKGSWAYPGGEVARKVLDATDHRLATALVALTRGEDTPLAATRAGLFGTSLDSGTALPVYAYPGASAEAIVVMVRIEIN